MEERVKMTNEAIDAQFHIHQRESRQRDYESKVSRLNSSRVETIKALDKSLITLSAGALTLSITFIYTIIGPNTADWLLLLFLSWAFFAICIYSSLFGFYFSGKLHECALAIVASEYRGQRRSDAHRQLETDSNRLQ